MVWECHGDFRLHLDPYFWGDYWSGIFPDYGIPVLDLGLCQLLSFMNYKLILTAIVCLLFDDSGAGQTNESQIAIYNRVIHKQSSWGAATNNIQFGIMISSIGKEAADKFKVLTFLYNQGTNTIFGLWRLPSGYRLEMTLKNKSGEEVAKTHKGKALSMTPFSWTLPEGHVVVLDPKSPSDYDAMFDLRSCFNIKKSGAYILTIKARLYAMSGFQKYVELDLPEAQVDVVLSDSDLGKGSVNGIVIFN